LGDLVTSSFRTLGPNRRQIFVASFTAAADLLSQWRAYSHGSSGVSLAFDLRALRPPDDSGNLTLLASSNEGKFSVAHVRESIMGDKLLVAHGTREMPIWGPMFHQIESDVDRGNVRLENLRPTYPSFPSRI
jgi:hypothetical protein